MIKASTNLYSKPLPLDELKAEDILWLDKALKSDYHGTTAEDILNGVYNGKYELWRLDPAGIAVTYIVDALTWRELICTAVAGEEFVENLARLIDELSDVARAYGCAFISCLATREATKKLYAKFGESKGELFTRELL